MGKLTRKEVANMENGQTIRQGLTQRPEHRARVLRPVDHLMQNVAEARVLNQADEEALRQRQGERFKDTLHQFAAVHPDEVPRTIPFGDNIVIFPHTMTGYNALTQRPLKLDNMFWANHGYDILQRVILASSDGRNGHTGI